jgi:hypothetical protein
MGLRRNRQSRRNTTDLKIVSNATIPISMDNRPLLTDKVEGNSSRSRPNIAGKGAVNTGEHCIIYSLLVAFVSFVGSSLLNLVVIADMIDNDKLDLAAIYQLLILMISLSR